MLKNKQKKTDEKWLPIYLVFFNPLSRVACFWAVILHQWYLFYTEQRSRVLLHWFFCFVMTLNSASVLSAKWTSHSVLTLHTHAHWHTMTDSHEHITWYKIICYFETIDLWVVQWNISLSEASLQQSILTCSPIHCILMMWSIYLLRCWLYRNKVSWSREKYENTKKRKNKYDKNTTARWHCFIF